MALIKILNGVKHINWGSVPMQFIYDYQDALGSHTVAFTAAWVPKIGDSIDTVAGVLVPLVGYDINNDPGKAQGRPVDDPTWPSRIRAQ